MGWEEVPEPVKAARAHAHAVGQGVALHLSKARVVVFRDHDVLSAHDSSCHDGQP
jgi:hypothetical protein